MISHLYLGIFKVDEFRLQRFEFFTEVVEEEAFDELELVLVDAEVERAEVGSDAYIRYAVTDFSVQVALRLHHQPTLVFKKLARLAADDVRREDEVRLTFRRLHAVTVCVTSVL